MARNISCEGKKRQGGFARWMWSIRDLVARHGVFGMRFRRQYSHTLSRNIWKKHCHIGGFDNCCIHVIFIRKIFPHVAWAFIGQKQQKSPHMAGLHKKTNFAESMFTQCWAGGTPAPQAPQRRRAKSPGQRPPAVQPSAGSAPRHHRAHRQILKHGRNRCAR